MYVGLRDAGNNVPIAQRVRAVLDVLDDVRQRLPIDPERTYLTGFSGGSAVACRTAFRLPEAFGGVVAIGHAPELPAAPWLRDRLRDRLSVAIVCGDRDPAAPWIEELSSPSFEAAGVRTETLLLRRVGHRMPSAEPLEAAFEWLEEGVAARRATAREFPASSMAGAPSRREWADQLLAEAEARLTDPELIDSGLRQLEGIRTRWPDLPASQSAERRLADFAGRKERPWEQVRAVQDRRLLQVEAEGFARLAEHGAPPLRARRAELAKSAETLWSRLREQAVAEERAMIDERLQALATVVAAAAADPAPIPLPRVRFNMTGEVTVREGLGHLQRALAPLGYELAFDESSLKLAGIDLKRKRTLKLPAATLEDIENRFLRPAGLRMQRVKNVITVVAREDEKAPAGP